jgi:hypothetical protein
MSADDDLDVEKLAANVSPRLARRVIELPPFAVLDDSGVDWDGAIIFVSAGEIEIECASGARARFHGGDILCFAPFPTRVVRNTGTEHARLLAIWRR